MQNELSTPLKRGRGHPGLESRSEVAVKLLAAAELQLEKTGLAHVTERTIAAEAGVNHAMIHYYFGGMDGLLAAVLDHAYADITSVYHQLSANTEWFHHQATRHLIKKLIEAYYAKPWLARIMVSLVTPEYSAMRDIFLKRYGPRGQIQLQRLLDQMIKQGIYDRKVDTAYVAMSMMSILTAPLSLTRLTDSVPITLDDLKKDRWIDHVTDLFDRQLRSS
jgi:TetR/AcrR family transcriptional regulator